MLNFGPQQAPTNPNQLLAALRSQQPPPNPGTPLERVNPDQQALEHYKSAAVSLERATQFINDPHMVLVTNAMIGALNKALLKFDGNAVMQALQESIASLPPTGAPGPGAPQQAPQPQGMPQGAPGGGAPAAPPQQGPATPMPRPMIA